MSLQKEKESGDDAEIVDNKKEISYEKIGRKPINKRENKEVEDSLDNPDRKKPKNNKINFENIIQKWLDKQETRQIEADKRKEEQMTELLQMKQQNDMMLFGLLNNLTNCLSSLHGKSNNQSENMNQGNIFALRVRYTITLRAQNILILFYFFTGNSSQFTSRNLQPPLPSFTQLDNTLDLMGYQSGMDDNLPNRDKFM
jgi:hypothetical protein